MDEELATLTKFIDTLVEFSVTYGFQILGALVFLVIGLKIAGWAGRKTASLASRKNVDPTLAKFFGSVARIVIIAVLIIITLGNFGISTAPLIALAGAAAFGVTIAMQGPLSNYGAGLAIILGRPFTVGDTITLGRISGMVENVKLAGTVLVGEDGERITIPNREIVGKVIVNSAARRVVQTKIAVAADTDIPKAIDALRHAFDAHETLKDGPGPQIGVHDFTYGGLVLGVRYWVPSRSYFEMRYKLNHDLLTALREAGVQLLSAHGVAVLAHPLTADDEGMEGAEG